MHRTCLLLAALAAAPALAGIDLASIDRGADACTDFYGFANGKWMQSTTLPPDRSRWGTFQMLEQRNEQVLVKAFDEAMARPLPPAGTPERKVVQYYASGMDLAAIEKAGLAPLQPLLREAASVRSGKDLPRVFARLHRQGVKPGFGIDVDPDSKESTRYLLELRQGGLGLPDRDYYFLDDERTKRLRDGYRRHVASMFELAGDSSERAAANADRVMALETELARASMTAVERRDIDKTYNKTTLDAFVRSTPGFAWRAFLDDVGARGVKDLNPAQPAFLRAFAKLAAERPAADWQAYLRWHVLHAAADKLPKAFDDEHFDFFERQFGGIPEQAPRHRRVLVVVGGRYGESGLGMAIGRIFVDKTFSPEAKARALELINNVKAALEDRLRAVDWMTEETRKRSLEKLAAMDVKIGYPDRWRDYSRADVGPYSFVENWMRASAFDLQRDLARIGKAVDRSDWYMSPHIVNAYYNGRGNEIVFPAAILQPPYFDPRADDALNYGGIGMVIGHEITHGFDDRGRRFDKDGNLRDWWTPEDERRYKERAEKIVTQYGGMEGVEGVKPNGRLTLGENISDVGGMKIAFDALKKALAKKPQGPIDGLTPEQRFFLSFGQAWRTLARVEWERNSLLTGQHSLPRFRVKGPLAHMPEFAQAFSCDPNRALLAEGERANIW